ncbi:hypothetical protein IFM89_033277 [Coptis chinensis]|uniref:Uncharacterized protein n=1 Tax=Coptis chinensis TaxID=261450 RepID=A0A835MAX6_9MAGN|nr:hypothetical protein IFM89_033277 [Coptis chinensis]
MELLSKRKALSWDTSREMISIVMLFTSALEHNQLDQFLEFGDVKEFGTKEIYTIAKLAVRCVAMPSTEMPTMKEVADVLDGLNKEHQNVTCRTWMSGITVATSQCCSGIEVEFMPELELEELSFSFTG